MDKHLITSRPFLAAFLFLIPAAALRFLALDQQSLWNDELFSIIVAKLPLSQIPGQLAQSYFHPPVYFALLHFMVEWFGTSEHSLRFLSALSGSLTVGALFLITRKLFDDRTAVWAALFCLIAPFHIAYSQEARPYALAGLLCVLNLFAVWQAWIRKRSMYYILYTLVTAAAIYTHHWVIFLVAAQAVYVIVDGAIRRESLKFVLLSYLALGLLYLPIVGTVLHQTEKVAASPWWWAEPASVSHLLRTDLAFSGAYFKLASGVFESPLVVKILLATISFSLLALAVLVGIRRGPRPLQLVLVSLFGTVTIAFGFSFFRPEAYLWYRYPVIVFPLFCMVLSVGLNLIRRIPLRLLLAGIYVFLAAMSTFRYYHWEKANAKSVAAFVETVASERTDLVIRPSYFQELFNYYYHGKAQQVDEGPFDSTIAPAIRTVDRFVLITLDIPNEVREYIDAHFEKVVERKFPGEAHMGIVVGVYRKKISSTVP
ncbi:MAG: glycosyltransferase family 39 protein [Bacteroidota bacterium]